MIALLTSRGVEVAEAQDEALITDVIGKACFGFTSGF